MNKGGICILCGSSGSGKTTTLLHLLADLSPEALDCRGILCPPVFKEGKKNGIDLLDVSTRETARLAELNLTGETNLATRGWILDPQAVHLGNAILRNATPCDIFFVDELGPLEFERGEGLMEGFPAINSRQYQLAIVTVRPSLLSAALRCWPDACVFDVNQADQEALVHKIIEVIHKTMNFSHQ